MKLAKKQNSGSGSLPEYGAIFMSNSVTKKECLRRKLFGLPSTFCNFVKHIKAGMILFLFEHEKRKLYGVFEACSDGAMNIIPDAFSSTGLHCPAQVKVKSIWICEPLLEREFHDAIKENYFSAKKFNFGLSKAQVLRLLQLFSLRKLVEPEQQLAKSRNAKSTMHSLHRVRQIDDSKCKVNDRVNGVYVWAKSYVDIDPQSAITTEDPSLDLDRVESDDSKFATYGWGRNESHLHTVLQPAISSEYSKYHSGEVRRVSGDGFLTNDEFQIECYKDSNFEPTVRKDSVFEPTLRIKYPSLLQSKLGRSFDSMEPLLVTNPLVPDRIKPPSPSHHQMDPQLLANLSSKASYRDAVAMGTHPYDSIFPGLNHQCPSTNEVKINSTVEGCLPSYGYSEKFISSSTTQSFSSYPEPIGMNKYPNKYSTFRDHVSFLGPSRNDNSYHGTIMGLSQAAYSAADVPSMRTTIDPMENKGSYYPLSSNMYPSLMDDYGYQIEPKDLLEHEAAWRKKDEAFMDNTTSLFENPFTLQGCVSSVDPQSMQHYQHDYDLEPCQSSDTLHSVPPKNRISVFSRLAFASDTDLSGHDADIHYEVNDLSKSVDGIMEILHKKHNEWVKLVKPKPGNKQDDVGKVGSKRIATAPCKAKMDCSKNSAKDMKVDCFPAAAKGVKIGRSQDGAEDMKIDPSVARAENMKVSHSLAGAENMKVDHSVARAENIKVDCSLAGAEDTKVDCSIAGAGDTKVVCCQENVTQLSGAKSFLDFKRRSEMHKPHNDVPTACHSSTSMSEGVLGGQQRKRKLVRPNFSKRDSTDDNGVKNCTSILRESAQEIPIIKDCATSMCEVVPGGQQKRRKLVRPVFSTSDSSGDKGIKNCTLILRDSAQEMPVIKDKIAACEASTANQNNENKKLFQIGNEPHLIRQSDHGDGDSNSERRDTRGGNCHGCKMTGYEVEKESANNKIEVQNATISDRSEVGNPNGDLIVNGPSLDHHKTSYFVVHETLLQLPEEKVETGNEFAGDECERNDKVDLLHRSVDETGANSSHHASTKSIFSSSNQFSELQMEGKEHTTIHVDTCEENVQEISLRSGTKPSGDSLGKPNTSQGFCQKRKLKR